MKKIIVGKQTMIRLFRGDYLLYNKIIASKGGGGSESFDSK